MDSSWKVELYRSWDEVDSPGFAEQLRQWMEHAPDAHVFYHPVILKAWTDTMRKLQNVTPLYVVARYEEITFFLPLILWKRNWKNAFLRVIIPAGFSDFDYHDPVVTAPVDHEIMDRFWKEVDDVVFNGNNVHYDEISISGISLSGKNLFWSNDNDTCPYSDLTPFENYNAFFSSLKKSLRHDLEKKSRRLSEFGDLSYRCYKPDEVPEALLALPAFLEAHRKRWPNAYKAPGLHAALLSMGIPAGVVHFSELSVNGQIIDWNLGFLFKSRFYYYMSTSPYLEKYAKYSPGKIHLSYLLRECFDNNVKLFDYLRGAHGYKGEWTKLEKNLFRFSYKSRKLNSMLRLVGYNSLALLREHLNFLVKE